MLPPSAGIPWNPTLFEQSVVALKREDLEPPTTYRPKGPNSFFPEGETSEGSWCFRRKLVNLDQAAEPFTIVEEELAKLLIAATGP